MLNNYYNGFPVTDFISKSSLASNTCNFSILNKWDGYKNVVEDFATD